MGFEDDAAAPTDFAKAWCAVCGRPLEDLTGMCDHCRRDSVSTTKAKRVTWRERRTQRAQFCTICQQRFAKDDARAIVHMPKGVLSHITPRTTTVHEECAPLGLWPAYWEGGGS
jgi:hypothetical protein